MINNRQNGRRRGRGSPQVRNGSGNNPERGNRIDNRARGNAAQLHEKYRNSARDAQTQGDRVMTEYYLQFADHYFRVLNESRARFEEQNPNQAQRRPIQQNDDFDEGFEGELGDENGEAETAPRRFDREPRRETGYEEGGQPERDPRSQNGGENGGNGNGNGYNRDNQNRDNQQGQNQGQNQGQPRDYREGNRERANRDGGNRDSANRENANRENPNRENGGNRDTANRESAGNRDGANRDNGYARDNGRDNRNDGRTDNRPQPARDARPPMADRDTRPARTIQPPAEQAQAELAMTPPVEDMAPPRPRRGRPPRRIEQTDAVEAAPAQIEVDRLPPAFAPTEPTDAAPAPRGRRKSAEPVAEPEIHAVEGEAVEPAPRRRRIRREATTDDVAA